MITFRIAGTDQTVVIRKDVEAIMKLLGLPPLRSFRLELDQLPGLQSAIAVQIEWDGDLDRMSVDRRQSISANVTAGFMLRMLKELAHLTLKAREQKVALVWEWNPDVAW